MPKRRQATLLEDLPEEIIDKILIRLPSKDVGRYRAVSTSWHSATSTPEFMLEHHRRQPSLPIIDGDGRPASLVFFRDTVGASSQQLWPFIPGFKHRSESRLQGACDGFIVVSSRHLGSRFYICNPVIRKHALLPQPQVGKDFHNTIVGFYRHHPTREYRVLWVSQSQDWTKSSLYILTVGSDKPRHVRVVMPIASSPSVEQKLLKELSYSYSPPVHHHGSLHWCRNGLNKGSDITGGGDIIVFDTEDESFRWMSSPTQPCTSKRLFDMNGTLAFWGCSIAAVMNVWVMNDYETEIWALKYQIDLSTVEASRQLYLASLKKKRKMPLDSTIQYFNDMVLLNERELLISFNENHVLRCDIHGKFLGMAKLGKSQYRMLLAQHRLQESLIPIPSQEMQGEDEEPSFSTGHV